MTARPSPLRPQPSPGRWGIGAALLTLVATLGSASLAVIPDLALGDDTLTRRIVGQLGSMITQNAIFVALPVVIVALLLQARPAPSAFGLRTPSRPWMTAGAVVVAFVGYLLISNLLGSLLDVGDRKDSQPATLGATESVAAGIAIALGVTILAPVGEEFLMRGVVYPGMRDGLSGRIGPWAAIAVAAGVNGLIFGALHGATDLIFIPMLMTFGIVLCLLYQLTGSLYAPIALHLTNNTVAIATALEWTVLEGLALWLSAAAVLSVAARVVGAGTRRSRAGAPEAGGSPAA